MTKEEILYNLKRIVIRIHSLLLNFIFLFKRSRKHNTKYYFSICAIFKNEAKYLEEWIEYNKVIGVDHLYLYNNFSSDNYRDGLSYYIDKGYVTLYDWPVPQGQMSAYEDCYKKNRDETYWLMFLDIDEFIVPKYSTDIKQWIKKYEKYPSVIIYWLMFGSSGKIYPDTNKLLVEQYVNCWEGLTNVSKQVLNTAYKPIKIYHHYLSCKVKFLGITFRVPSRNEGGEFKLHGDNDKCPTVNTIQINHYWSKSYSEYNNKIKKGDVFSKQNEELRSHIEFFYKHELKNISLDFTIFRFIIKLKLALQKKHQEMSM